MILKYLLGSLIGLAVTWLLASRLLPGAPAWIYDDVMETANLAPGPVRYVGEAIGHIEQDKALAFDLAGIDLTRDKVLIWGDSQIHALALQSGERLHSRLERIRGAGRIDYGAVALGRGGYSIGDWHHRIPIGERHFAPVVAHLLLISAVHDLLPGGEGERADQLVPGPPPRFVYTDEAVHRAHAERLNNLAPSWVVEGGLYPLYREVWLGRPLVTGYLRPSHWLARLRDVQSATPSAPPDRDRPRFSPQAARDIWRQVLPTLRARTSLPVVIAYAPRVPRLRGGRVVTEDPHDAWITALIEVANESGIDVIDMRPSFRALYDSERRFPRGFATSRPDAGHLNAIGTSLIADAIAASYPDATAYGAAPR